MGSTLQRVVIVGCALLLAAPGVAAAQARRRGGRPPEAPPHAVQLSDEDAEARMHFNLGQRYYQTGRFAEAAREFRQAYDLTHLPELLYNAFLGHRESGQYDEAIAALEEYLPHVTSDAQRQGVEARLAALRELRERIRSGQEATPEPSESSRPESAQPEDAQPAETEEGAQPAEPERDGAVAAPAAAMPPQGASDDLAWAPWALFGGGLAVVGGGAIAGAIALERDATLDGLCDPALGCSPGYEAAQAEGAAASLAADVLLIGGSAIAIGGLVWAIVQATGATSAPIEHARLECSPHGCALYLRGEL